MCIYDSCQAAGGVQARRAAAAAAVAAAAEAAAKAEASQKNNSTCVIQCKMKIWDYVEDLYPQLPEPFTYWMD